ncbi:MAG: hypothetical protein IPK19_01870 [Chloroflexi bacterium]|nr:hypothetical protein [Chloroflexota bacterium]
MEDEATILQRARDKYERDDMEGARTDFRAAALLEPTSEVLLLLSESEKHEILAYRRRLASRFPDSIPVLMDRAGALERAGYREPAIKTYAQVIGLSGLTPRQSYIVHTARLRLACQAKSHELILEDFAALWKITDGPLIRLRHTLLRIITEEIQDSANAQVLLDFALSNAMPSWLTEVIEKHIETLKSVEYAFEQIG